MKKKILIPQMLLWILVAGLLASLMFNLVQYNRADASSSNLKGTYCTDVAGVNGTYLVFDANGHFCLYTQSQGLLEEGNYDECGENLYWIESTTGSKSNVLLAGDGVYYASEDGTLERYARFNDTPTFVGDWSQEWSHWPDGPYEMK